MAAKDERLDWGVFHDGDIVGVQVSGESLRFKIEIDYLAERMVPKTSFFTVRTDKVKWVKYESYTGETECEPGKIEKLRPDILSFKSEGDVRILECSDGTLSIEYSSEELFNDNNNSIAIQAIYTVARNYWESFGNQDIQQ